MSAATQETVQGLSECIEFNSCEEKGSCDGECERPAFTSAATEETVQGLSECGST